MTQLFLTAEQLEDMTGYRSHAGQIGWLRDNGYAFEVRKDGRPNVLLDQVRERQCRKAESTPGPDWSWLKSAV
jgi:hypothetical protein